MKLAVIQNRMKVKKCTVEQKIQCTQKHDMKRRKRRVSWNYVCDATVMLHTMPTMFGIFWASVSTKNVVCWASCAFIVTFISFTFRKSHTFAGFIAYFCFWLLFSFENVTVHEVQDAFTVIPKEKQFSTKSNELESDMDNDLTCAFFWYLFFLFFSSLAECMCFNVNAYMYVYFLYLNIS